MKINLKNIAIKTGISIVVVSATLGCGIAIEDAVIDHEKMICPITEIENALGFDGNIHQQKRITEEKLYMENSLLENILPEDYNFIR